MRMGSPFSFGRRSRHIRERPLYVVSCECSGLNAWPSMDCAMGDSADTAMGRIGARHFLGSKPRAQQSEVPPGLSWMGESSDISEHSRLSARRVRSPESRGLQLPPVGRACVSLRTGGSADEAPAA